MLCVRSESSFGVYRHIFFRRIFVCLAVFLFIFPFLLSADTVTILFSTDEDFSINLLQPTDDNVVTYSSSTFDLSSLLPPGSLPAKVCIDALGILSQNEIVISLDEDATINATLYADEDLIQFNGSNFSLWWDGSLNGLPAQANLDAVYIISVSPQVFLFSLEENATLPGVGLVADEDVIRFSDGTFSIEIDGSSIGIPESANIDGIGKRHYTQNYVFSLDGATTLGGKLYDDADVVEYTGSGFEMYFSSSVAGLPSQININAIELLGSTEVPTWMIFK